MRLLLGTLALLGCEGSTGHAPPVPPAPPAVLQTAASGVVTGTSVSLPVAPLGGGNLVVVAIATANASEPFAESLVTDSGGGESHGLWWSWAECGSTVPIIDVWTISSATAGSTAISVELKAPSTFEVFAVEAQGMSTELIPVAASASADGYQTTAQAPPMDAVSGQLLVSTMATCGTVGAIVPGNQFTTLNAQNGTAVAYLLAPNDGAYGAAWSYSGTSWHAQTDSFQLR